MHFCRLSSLLCFNLAASPFTSIHFVPSGYEMRILIVAIYSEYLFNVFIFIIFFVPSTAPDMRWGFLFLQYFHNVIYSSFNFVVIFHFSLSLTFFAVCHSLFDYCHLIFNIFVFVICFQYCNGYEMRILIVAIFSKCYFVLMTKV